MKGGKAGQGRRRPPVKLDPLEKLQQKQRQGPKRGVKKKDWGANEREVPVVPKPTKR